MKTLNRTIFFFLWLALFQMSFDVNAQFNVGLTINKVMSNAKSNTRNFGTPDGKFLYEFGFMSENTDKSFGITMYKSFEKLFLNVNVTYRESNIRYVVKEYTKEFRSQINYIDESHQTLHIPVVAGLNFNNFKVGAGAFFNFHLNNDNALGKTFPFVNKNRKLDTGVELFIGYKLFNRVLLFTCYEKSFVRVGDHIYYNQQSTRIRSVMDNISFGLSIYPGGMD